MQDRVTILQRQESHLDDFGRVGGDYIPVQTIWANVSFTKGKRALNVGAIEAYDTCMVRCDYHPRLTRECRLSFRNGTYQIESFNADERANEVQITCVEVQNA